MSKVYCALKQNTDSYMSINEDLHYVWVFIFVYSIMG